MKRREFIALFGGAAAWPFAARAEQSGRVRRVGVLMAYTADDPEGEDRHKIFRQALSQLGWVDGYNVHIDTRWPGSDVDQIRKFAKELVGLMPDVVVVAGTPAVTTLQDETRTTPIVFVGVTDPVGQHLVESLAHPAGNATGFSLFEPSMGSKWLELIKEIAPGTTRVGIIFNPETAAGTQLYLNSLEAAAPSFSVQIIVIQIRNDEEVQREIISFGDVSGNALIVLPDIFSITHRKLILQMASQYRLPAIYFFSYFAREGGLISYGVDTRDLYRRAASYVDRIFKHANRPADLPVQQPTKFELAINLRTAKALGLTVPPSLLTRADEVME
jgi:putative tryptophan/tyrosine transport system substrate-binding protein